jgi:predicted  nucleic acid-binding Zn-ribbon protein
MRSQSRIAVKEALQGELMALSEEVYLLKNDMLKSEDEMASINDQLSLSEKNQDALLDATKKLKVKCDSIRIRAIEAVWCIRAGEDFVP